MGLPESTGKWLDGEFLKEEKKELDASSGGTRICLSFCFPPLRVIAASDAQVYGYHVINDTQRVTLSWSDLKLRGSVAEQGKKPNGMFTF